MSTLNLAKMTVSGSPGTGTLTLGAAVAPYQTFAAAGAVDGATYSYVIQENAKFECGHGVYTASGTTFSRVTVFDSSAGFGTKENFTSAAQVYSAMLSQDTITVGKQDLWIPYTAMTPRTTNGSSGGQLETSTNKVNLSYGSFDPSVNQYAQFSLQMPKSWNPSAGIYFTPVWLHPATTTNFNVVWACQAVALRNAVALDTAFGTAQSVTDTGGSTNTLYVGPESPAITVGGSPQEEDFVMFQVYRDAASGSDTLAVNAYLAGIQLTLTTDAENDD